MGQFSRRTLGQSNFRAKTGHVIYKFTPYSASDFDDALIYQGGNELGSTEEVLGGSNGPAYTFHFGNNFTPISDAYPAISPSSYVVQTNDTLQSIAQAVYGDASLWYVIADANSIEQGAPLVAGTVLNLPNTVVASHDNASTFKPYNPSQIVGDITPQLPPPSKPSSDFLAAAIIAVVAAVATVVTAGAALSVLAPTLLASDGILATGAAVFDGVAFSTAVGAAQVAAVIGAAAIGGAVGSIASQLTGDALGVSHGFSFANVAVGAFATAATVGVAGGVGLLDASPVVAGLEDGALDSVANQGIGVAFGTQKSFSWSSVAANALVGGLSAGVGVEDPQINKFSGIQAQDFNALTVAGESADGFVTGIATQEIAVALGGYGKIDISNIAADSFGNALGNSIVGAIETTPGQTQQQNSQQNADQNVAVTPTYNGPALGGDIGAPFAPLPTIPSYADTSGAPPTPSAVAGTNTGGGSTAAVAQQAVADAQATNDFNAQAPATQSNGNTGVGYALDANGNPVPGSAAAIQGVTASATRPGFFSSLVGDLGAGDFSAAGTLIYKEAASAAQSIGSALAYSGNHSATDALYLPGPISNARFNLGAASNTVNGALNLINLPVNSALNLIGAVTQPVAEYQGELLSLESGFPGGIGGIAEEGTSILAATSLAIRGAGEVAETAAPIAGEGASYRYFYRGDSTLRSEFLSPMAQSAGVDTTQSFLASRSTGELSDVAAEHGLASSGSPYISTSSNPEVADYFARGPNQDQTGFVTVFRIPESEAQQLATPNFDNFMSFEMNNPAIGQPEAEFLFKGAIDPKYIYQQYQVQSK